MAMDDTQASAHLNAALAACDSKFVSFRQQPKFQIV
jgi:hypothetical protein